MTTETEQEPRYFKDVCSDILNVMFDKSHDKNNKITHFKEYLGELKQKYDTEITTLWLRNLLSNEMTERQKTDKINKFVKRNNIKTDKIKRSFHSLRTHGLNEKHRLGNSEILHKIIM